VLLGCVKEIRLPPFVLSFFHCVRIYPSPELSSKDSASVVCCSSMGVLFYFAVRSQVRMACGNMHLSPFDSRAFHVLRSSLYTREKSFGNIENKLPFCTLVSLRALSFSEPWFLNVGTGISADVKLGAEAKAF
jgi:hypothetical protein